MKLFIYKYTKTEKKDTVPIKSGLSQAKLSEIALITL